MNSEPYYLQVYKKIEERNKVNLEFFYNLIIKRCKLSTEQADFLIKEVVDWNVLESGDVLPVEEFCRLSRYIAAFQSG